MYLGLYFFILSIVLVMSMRNSAIAYGYLLSIFSLEQWLQTKDVFFVTHSSFVNITSGLVILFSAILGWVKNKQNMPTFSSIYLLIIVLYGYAFLSCFWSPVPNISFSNYVSALPYIMLTILVAPLTIVDLVKTDKMLIFLVVFGSVLLVILLTSTDWGYRTVVLAGNNAHLKTNPLALASFSGYVFIASMFMDGRSKLRYLRWFVAILCLLFAVKTGSRGQFIFMIFSVLIFFPLSKPKINFGSFFYVLFFGLILVGLSYLIMLNFSGIEQAGSQSRWSGGGLDRDFSNRFAAAQNLLFFWLKSPLSIFFGLGSSASFSKEIFGFYVHMVPFEVLGELGLLGFSIYFIILFKTYKSFKKSFFTDKLSQAEKNILASLYAMLLFEFLLSFKQGSLLGSVPFFGIVVVTNRVTFMISKSSLKSNSN
ncbi:hypothetical protein Metme_0415 [Methylomonas methanica MC09]|uniref:O-antigen ligase-related domain-containing protein n=2 Tax=Methylomonas methanica TaxID=421 RepID=G0A1G7_METMM|nr:hypothetical protein Metme_0415 [Methylomonas methanica MC09]